MILNLDPGTEDTAYTMMLRGQIVDEKLYCCPLDRPFAKVENRNILRIIYCGSFDAVVCEEIRSYGMAIGKSTIDTIRWIGRFEEACSKRAIPFVLVGRQEVKLHWCKSARAKDSNVRQALIDHYGEQGTKANPGPTYGMSKDVWSALAIGGYYYANSLTAKKGQYGI